jgi:hypothetical protein
MWERQEKRAVRDPIRFKPGLRCARSQANGAYVLLDPGSVSFRGFEPFALEASLHWSEFCRISVHDEKLL